MIPYWLVNLAMGLTAIRPRTYIALTVAGLLPATFIYVTAGTQLVTIDSASDIVSANLVVTLLLLSLFPLLAKGARVLVQRVTRLARRAALDFLHFFSILHCSTRRFLQAA